MMRLPSGSVPPPGKRKAHAPAVDPGLRHRLRFFDFVPDGRLQRGEKLDGLPHVFIRQPCGDHVHPRGALRRLVDHGILSSAALEILHLPHHVRHGQTRERGRFRMTLSRHQMAGSAGLRLEPVLHDPRQRGVLLRIPIRRVELIVNLRLRVRLGASRKPLQLFRIAGRRRILVRHWIRPRKLPRLLWKGMLRQRHDHKERQQHDEN